MPRDKQAVATPRQQLLLQTLISVGKELCITEIAQKDISRLQIQLRVVHLP